MVLVDEERSVVVARESALAERRPIMDTIRGVVVTDPYRYLEAADPDEHPWIVRSTQAATAYLKGCRNRTRVQRLLRQYSAARGARRRMPQQLGEQWLLADVASNGKVRWCRGGEELLFSSEPPANAIWLPDPEELAKAEKPPATTLAIRSQRINRLLAALLERGVAPEVAVDAAEALTKRRTRTRQDPVTMIREAGNAFAGGRLLDIRWVRPHTVDITIVAPSKDRAVLRFVRQSDRRWLLVAVSRAGAHRPVTAHPSPDGRYVAFVIHSAYGRAHADLVIVEVEDGSVASPMRTLMTSGRVQWLPDSRGLLVNDDAADGERTLIVERIGGGSYEIPLPADAQQSWPVLSACGTLVALARYERGMSSLPWIRQIAEHATWQSFMPQSRTHGMGVLLHDRYVMVDYSRSIRGRIVAVPLTEASEEDSWTELVPAGPGVIESIQLASDRLLVTVGDGGANRLDVRTLKGQLLRTIDAPDLGRLHVVAALPERRSGNATAPRAVLSLSSAICSHAMSLVDLDSGELTTVDASPVTLSAVVRRITATAEDGTVLDATVVLPPDAAAEVDAGRPVDLPTIIYAHGYMGVGAGANLNPLVGTTIDLGAAYVFAHIRGGNEYGRGDSWKRTVTPASITFSDLFTLVEALVRDRIADAGRVGLMTHCMGGILAAAAIAFRPDLFRAVAATAPMIDPIRLFIDPRTGELSSREDAGSFATKRSTSEYLATSGYHNLKDRDDYPAVFLGWPVQDRISEPWHCWKLAAALQHASRNGGQRSLVLRRWEGDHSYTFAARMGTPLAGACDLMSFMAAELGVR